MSSFCLQCTVHENIFGALKYEIITIFLLLKLLKALNLLCLIFCISSLLLCFIANSKVIVVTIYCSQRRQRNDFLLFAIAFNLRGKKSNNYIGSYREKKPRSNLQNCYRKVERGITKWEAIEKNLICQCNIEKANICQGTKNYFLFWGHQ